MIFNAEKFKLWSHSQTEYSAVTFLSRYFLSLYYAAKFWIWALALFLSFFSFSLPSLSLSRYIHLSVYVRWSSSINRSVPPCVYVTLNLRPVYLSLALGQKVKMRLSKPLCIFTAGALSLSFSLMWDKAPLQPDYTFAALDLLSLSLSLSLFYLVYLSDIICVRLSSSLNHPLPVQRLISTLFIYLLSFSRSEGDEASLQTTLYLYSAWSSLSLSLSSISSISFISLI